MFSIFIIVLNDPFLGPLNDRWTIPLYRMIMFNDSFFWSFGDVFNDHFFLNGRWPIGFQRSLFTIVGRLFSTIPLYDRRPIWIQRPLFTIIVGRSFSTVPCTIDGRSEYNDLFLRSWPLVFDTSRFFHDRWLIGMHPPLPLRSFLTNPFPDHQQQSFH